MKQISNKAFEKFITLMANQPMTAERLSTILDANQDESIDAYFFGRLAKVTVKDKEALLSLLKGRVRQCIYRGYEFQSIEFNDVLIASVCKIEICYSYTYTHGGKDPETRNTSFTCLATDDAIDGIFEFEYKD